MIGYIRDSWDLHVAALIGFVCLGLVLAWCSAIPLWAVLPIAVAGCLISVFGGLWLLAICGGSIPW